MSEPTSGQSGSIDNKYGTINIGTGDVIVGNKTTTTTTTTYSGPTEIHNAWQPVDPNVTAPILQRALVEE